MWQLKTRASDAAPIYGRLARLAWRESWVKGGSGDGDDDDDEQPHELEQELFSSAGCVIARSA